jgi:hypothetical protein
MNLLDRQIKLEDEYTNQGILLAVARWEADLEAGRLADTGAGRSLTLKTYKLVVAELETICSAGTRGVGGRYRQLLREVGFDVCAIIAMRAALGLVGHARSKALRARGRDRTGEPIAQDFISDVGNSLEAEHILMKLTIAAPGYMHRVLQSLDETRTRAQNHRRRTLLASADNVGVGTGEVLWSSAEREGASRLILQAVVSAGIIETYHIPKSRGQHWVAIRAAPAIAEHIERMGNHIRAFLMWPPMLVPPKPHSLDTLLAGSSYVTPGMASKARTVQTRTRRADHTTWMHANMAPAVLAAGNKAAQQPYVIDVETATLLRDLYSRGVHNGLVGIPASTPIEVPAYPLPEGWDQTDDTLMEQHASWKATAREAYSLELVRKAHVLAFNQTLKYLREYAGDTLYFPTYFDWRGRLYFRSRINPQGTDFVKACLQFGNKKPLGSNGLYWLKAHIATCYGYDKRGIDARVVWADEHIGLIREAVQNHIDSDFFRAADSPWCFYVAARELVRALDSGSPETWETGVPVALDATCSGLQHLSALLRDPVGGMFTNLRPNNGPEKEDIYAAVAAVSVATIQKDTAELVQAQYWVDAGVPRSAAKRPVMTYVYGGTLTSCTEYVYLDMVDRGLTALPEYSQFKLASYLSRHLRRGIEAVVPAAAELMRFLRTLPGRMPEGAAMQWVSPAGFPVVQHYAQEEVVRLQLPAMGVQLNMTRFNDELQFRARCVNGIAPNFVHSLDSAHLVRVLNAFEGSLVPIHDSFATHPSDVSRMRDVLREEFVNMYTESDPLADLVARVQDHDHDEIGLPARGSLPIAEVLQSEFFMC